MTTSTRSGPDLRTSQRGQALAVFAGGLVALLVATGFVVDGGLAFVNRRDAQNQADLGALAGTHVILDYHVKGSGTGADVYNAIDKAVQDNGCLPSGDVPCQWTADYVRPMTGYDTATVGSGVVQTGAIPPTAQGVEVYVDRSPSTFFLGLIGQGDWDVGAEATGMTATIDDPGESILLPVAFDPGPDRDLDVYDPSQPGYQPPRFIFSEGKDAPGNFSWLAWDDSNDANDLVDSICESDNLAMSLPTYVPGGPGKMNKSQGRNCLDDYVGEIVYVPMWGDGGSDCTEGPVTENGASTGFCIIGLAAFQFEGYLGNPSVDNLYGTLQLVVPWTSVPANFSGPPCNPTDPNCNNLSSYIGLIK